MMSMHHKDRAQRDMAKLDRIPVEHRVSHHPMSATNYVLVLFEERKPQSKSARNPHLDLWKEEDFDWRSAFTQNLIRRRDHCPSYVWPGMAIAVAICIQLGSCLAVDQGDAHQQLFRIRCQVTDLPNLDDGCRFKVVRSWEDDQVFDPCCATVCLPLSERVETQAYCGFCLISITHVSIFDSKRLNCGAVYGQSDERSKGWLPFER